MNKHVAARDFCSETSALIDIRTACARAASQARSLDGHEEVRLIASAGRVLLDSVIARSPAPPFDQSAMDGYALSLTADIMPAGARFPMHGGIVAGERPGRQLPAGSAIRVLTGAALPAGANAVVVQERCHMEENTLVLHREVREGQNIPLRGEDVSPGQHLLPAGTRLDARHIALLAAQGLTEVAVKPRPRVAIISTGGELAEFGGQLSGPLIHDTNRPMLMALAGQAGLALIDGGAVADSAEELAGTLRGLAQRCDLIVTTGSASIGGEDHAAGAVELVGGTVELLCMALKPGKPALVGRTGNAAFLGLPGNPVSALVSWLLLGNAIVATLEGRPHRRPAGYPLPLAARFERRTGRTEFAPGRVVQLAEGQAVEILGRGGSARLRPLAEADGLVEIAPWRAPLEAGETVRFHPFHGGFQS